jgi:hypothetical protein
MRQVDLKEPVTQLIVQSRIHVFAIVDPDRWEAAWAAVRSKLVDLELLQRVVVARRGEDSEHEVLWPEDYGQESRLWEEPHYYLA